MVQLNYRVGDVFAVPLRDGGYGVGLVAREHDRFVLGYFFSGLHEQLPDLAALSFNRDTVIEVSRFGDDGLLDGSWPILGQLPGWQREDWPMPMFASQADHPTPTMRPYHPDNPHQMLAWIKVRRDELEGLPRGGFSPARAQMIGLNRLLRSPVPLPPVRIIPGPPAPEPRTATAPQPPAPEEAVRIYLQIPDGKITAATEAHLEGFEDAIDITLRDKHIGYLDGNETGQGEHILYLYGPDRHKLWEATQPLLQWSPYPPLRAYLREANPDAQPTIINLTS